ncbi:white collar 2 type of transcription factor [Mucor velutinosus]|uniref:White collar 2 type of transcription factor n=1 Tax=Mucor velutinosus TaxID=708070 RepID=A0AAN7DQE3_9FUNG|nr:white collar 2 type of transcription factor [Mucor velutinosus]
MQPQDLSKASHFTSSIDVDPNSIDFGLTSLPPASATDQTALSTFMVEVRHRLSRLESAHAEIAQLKTALAESEAARDALAAQLAAINAQSTTNVAPTTIDVVSSNTPTPPSTTSASKSTPSYSQSQVTAQPSFAAVVASNAGAKRKKKPAARPPPSATKASATLARLFAPQSDIPSGYQFVYYATPVRRRLSELRRLVQGVGLNNSRVLDIQYPVQNVISFLVHNDYVLTLTKAMHLHGRGCSPLIDFDPCDPVNLKDPKFASLSRDLRVQKAIEVENLRCLRSLSFVRRSVRVSVARSFLLYDRINQAQFDAILKEEMLARSSSSAAAKPPSRSSDQERLAKKQRLSYLGYLLHHDAETASLLAYAVSPTLSATKDFEMSEPSDN